MEEKNSIKICETCGKEIAVSAKTCPHCGAKNKKPKKKMNPWFWAVSVGLIAVVAVIVLTVSNLNATKITLDDGTTYSPEKFIAAYNAGRVQSKTYTVTMRIDSVARKSELFQTDGAFYDKNHIWINYNTTKAYQLQSDMYGNLVRVPLATQKAKEIEKTGESLQVGDRVKLVATTVSVQQRTTHITSSTLLNGYNLSFHDLTALELL